MGTQPSGPPIKPQPPCGGIGQPPCPPVSAVDVRVGETVHDGTPLYSYSDMIQYGADCYNHGRLDKTLEIHQAKEEMETDL